MICSTTSERASGPFTGPALMRPHIKSRTSRSLACFCQKSTPNARATPLIAQNSPTRAIVIRVILVTEALHAWTVRVLIWETDKLVADDSIPHCESLLHTPLDVKFDLQASVAIHGTDAPIPQFSRAIGTLRSGISSGPFQLDVFKEI